MHTKKPVQLILSFLGIIAFPSLIPVYGQAIKPEDFRSPIVKKIAGNLGDSEFIKKTTIEFVNNSKAPLMCKIQLKVTYEVVDSHIQKLRELDSYLASKNFNPKEATDFRQKITSELEKGTLVLLEKADEYCPAQAK